MSLSAGFQTADSNTFSYNCTPSARAGGGTHVSDKALTEENRILWRHTGLPHLVEGSADLGEDHLNLHVYLFGLLETRHGLAFGAKVPGNFLTRDTHMTKTASQLMITSFSSVLQRPSHGAAALP